MRRFVCAGALLFVAGVVVGGALTPSSPPARAASDGQRVCINKKTGAMRLASVKRCVAGESSTIFGEAGPAGSPGAAGPTGPAGPKGDTGDAGSSASVKTKTVTLRYTSSSGIFASCGSGSSSFLPTGKIYNGVLYDTSSLGGSWNWYTVYDCSITLKVVDE